jgi:AcrR family transcriptional regulator
MSGATGKNYESLLEAAEILFSRKGYASATLRDIATALGFRHASLYYYFPGGKEELFIEVMRYSIRRHGQALAEILDRAQGDIRAQLYGSADWFLSQPPLDLVRMYQSDMPAIDQGKARKLMEELQKEILLRLQFALQQADEVGQIHCPNPALVGGALVGMLESFHSMPDFAVRESKPLMAKELIDILLRGLNYRGSDTINFNANKELS